MTTIPQPRVGCGAAILRDNRLLLVQRLRKPEAGHWGLPGGKVDFGETVPAAIVREIMEELGIEIRLVRLLHVVDQIDPAAGQHWVSPTWLAEIASGVPVVQEPEALSACGWFLLDDLPVPLTEATRQTLTALRTSVTSTG